MLSVNVINMDDENAEHVCVLYTNRKDNQLYIREMINFKHVNDFLESKPKPRLDLTNLSNDEIENRNDEIVKAFEDIGFKYF